MHRATILVIPEIAHQLELVPLLWLVLLHFRGKACDAAWWWIAGAFFVSWLADTASHWVGQPIVGMAYPVAQAGIVGAVFLYRGEAIAFIVALMAVGVSDILIIGVHPHDIFFRTVAWLAICGIIYPLRQLDRLRASLLVTFGLGWFCWMIYDSWPGWTSYLVYKATWLAGAVLFCWASLSPAPHLKVIRNTQ